MGTSCEGLPVSFTDEPSIDIRPPSNPEQVNYASFMDINCKVLPIIILIVLSIDEICVRSIPYHHFLNYKSEILFTRSFIIDVSLNS